MSTVTKKACNIKINGKEVSVSEGTVILEACKQNEVPVSNLCYNRKLVPFAACRTCMVETVVDGKKELVYSCTQPVAEGMEVRTGTEETNRYNKACLEMLLVEHPLDCPICDKSGVCPLQDNTDMLQMFDGRFEIQRRNEPSIKTNPIIEFYLNRCIMCGLCVRACDEIQGVQALDFHKRGMSVSIGTANDEPLDCEFCGQCITVCPTGALMDMTSGARGLAALFTNTHTTCNYCSWGCTIELQSKKGQVIRIEADEGYDVGINEGNLCAKGRLGHGIIHNDQRIESPLMNVGGNYKEVTWEEALQTIADRMQATVNKSGPDSLAGIGSEKLTNEESFLFQKLFRGLGSNQVTNLANARAPYLNAFMLNCFENGIVSQPITKLQEADVVLVFNTDLPSEYPVGGNSIRFGTIFSDTDLLIANPRKVVFDSRAKIDVRMTYKHGSDLAVASRLSRIIIDNKLVDIGKAQSAVPNYNEWVQSLAPYTADAVEKTTGLPDDVLTRAAERFARDADRFVIVGNDILDTNQGEEILNALLNLCTLVQHGSTGSVSIYPPREHCNSQGVNDMGCTPEFLPGYQPIKDSSASGDTDLFQNCIDGKLKFLFIAGEDPLQSYYKPQLVKEALRTVPFLVVTDVFMTDTARMADLVLPSSTFAEKDGTYTNMSRHVQRVAAAVIPQGLSKPDFDILIELASALGKPFQNTDIASVQQEIENVAPVYKGVFPGDKSVQWKPDSANTNLRFHTNDASVEQNGAEGYPFTLQTNNHMFHIGSYSQYAKALVDIGPECIAELHPDDAKGLGISSGDSIVVESPEGKVEVKVKTSKVTSRGMLYIPKNWTTVPVNALRNGEEGLINVKISKAG